jgi:hypothetical protein
MKPRDIAMRAGKMTSWEWADLLVMKPAAPAVAEEFSCQLANLRQEMYVTMEMKTLSMTFAVRMEHVREKLAH